MTENKEPMIGIVNVLLIENQVSILNVDGEKAYSLALTNLERTISADEKRMVLRASFDLMKGMKNPVLSFTSTFAAVYERIGEGGMAWDEFSDPIALSHVIPYLREYISNITTRMQTGTIRIKPLNTYAMIEAYNKSKEQIPAVE